MGGTDGQITMALCNLHFPGFRPCVEMLVSSVVSLGQFDFAPAACHLFPSNAADKEQMALHFLAATSVAGGSLWCWLSKENFGPASKQEDLEPILTVSSYRGLW